jgi:hypothetical protein
MMERPWRVIVRSVRGYGLRSLGCGIADVGLALLCGPSAYSAA